MLSLDGAIAAFQRNYHTNVPIPYIHPFYGAPSASNPQISSIGFDIMLFERGKLNSCSEGEMSIENDLPKGS